MFEIVLAYPPQDNLSCFYKKLNAKESVSKS